MRAYALGLVGLVVLTHASRGAAADLPLDKIEKAPNIDGALADFPVELRALSSNVQGVARAGDLAAKGAVVYDATNLYVAIDISDDTLLASASQDRAELVLVVGSAVTTVVLVPGQPGKTAGKVLVGGQEVKGSSLVEAPGKSGYTIEAKIPWAAIGGANKQRVGMRGGLFVFDADQTSVEAVVGSTASRDSSRLPAALTTPEQNLAAGLAKEKRFGNPVFSAIGNPVGDAMQERVLLFGTHLVVLGSSFRGGSEYYFNDMSEKGSTVSVLSTELRDIDGDGRDEVVFKKRFTKSGSKTSRDVLQVYSFASSDVANIVFAHEIGISNPKGSIQNEVSLAKDGTKVAITVKLGTVKGLDSKNYDEPRESSFDSVLLPWGDVSSRTYKHDGRTYAKTAEKTRDKPAADKPAGESPKPIADPKPAPKPAGPVVPDTRQVLALYKKDRGISETAKFDLAGDVDGNSDGERILLHATKSQGPSQGRPELAVVGPGVRKGSGYAFTTLPFASAADVLSVKAEDVTGDGKADLIVRGTLKGKGPKDEEVVREVELVFRVSGDQIKRVFGAEVGRSIGRNKISGEIIYRTEKGFREVVLRSGSASGFSKDNYPFNPDTQPVGGLEPLLLPWGDVRSLAYRFEAGVFNRR